MNYNLIAYTVYAPIVIALTIWVAKMLHKNTSAFLIEIFNVNEKVALATKLIAILPNLEFHKTTERDAQRRGIKTLETMLNNISDVDDKKQVLIALAKEIV